MAAAAEPRSEEEVIAKYKQLRQELGALSEKINELEGNVSAFAAGSAASLECMRQRERL